MDLVTTKRKKPRLDLCIISQKYILSEKTSSTEVYNYEFGWVCLVYPFFITIHRGTIQMPVTNLYVLWVDKKEKSETKSDTKINTTEAENEDILHSTPTLKRRKSDDSTITKYIICNMQYHNKSKKRFRFSSHKNLCLQ